MMITVEALNQGYEDLEQLSARADEFRTDDQPANQENRDEMLRAMGSDPACREWYQQAATAVALKQVVPQVSAGCGVALPEVVIEHLIQVLATQLHNGTLVGRLVGLREARADLRLPDAHRHLDSIATLADELDSGDERYKQLIAHVIGIREAIGVDTRE